MTTMTFQTILDLKSKEIYFCNKVYRANILENVGLSKTKGDLTSSKFGTKTRQRICYLQNTDFFFKFNAN